VKLRPRLVLGVVLVALPVAVLTTMYEAARERGRVAEIVTERTLARLESFTVADCESDPGRFPDVAEVDPRDWLFGGDIGIRPLDPPGVRYFVVDGHGRTFRDDAPRLPRGVRRAIVHGEAPSFPGVRDGVPVQRTIVRPDWSSNDCAAILVERPEPRAQPLAARLMPGLLVTLAVTLAILLIAGPIVERIRRLTAAVARGDARTIADARTSDRDELGELASAFAEREKTIAGQLDELAAREAALREHLAATSHDILLPVTVLQGHLVELERARAANEPLDVSILRGAIDESHYLTSLVFNLNADARLRTGGVVDAEVDLGLLVERARARNVPIAKHAGISLEVATPDRDVWVRGDTTLLAQAVSNLVHNAICYGRGGGHVAVVLEAKAGRFTLRVADDGPGVPESVLGALGDRGFRTDAARTRRPEGTGLGLHIVREVCARHGFSVRFGQGDPSGLVVEIEGPCESRERVA